MVVKDSTQKSIWVLMGMMLWEVTVRLGYVSNQIMPSLITVVQRTLAGLVDGTLLIQLFQSIAYVIAGVVVGVVLAMVMAVLGYFNHWLANLFDVYASILHPLPGIALLPIVILWFGIGGMAAYAIILHAVVWSQYLTLRDGLSQVEQSYIEVAGNNGATKAQLVSHVLLPLSSHAIILSLQMGWSKGWRALISAEMVFGAISALGGIGWYMYERRAFMDTPGMYSGILLVVIVGILMEELVFNRWVLGLTRKS